VFVFGAACDGSTLSGVSTAVYLTAAARVDHGFLHRAGRRDEEVQLGVDADPVERLGDADAADEDPASSPSNAVVAVAGRDPVVAVTADQDVVLAVSEEHVIAGAAVDRVVALAAVDLGAPRLRVGIDGARSDVPGGPRGL